MSLDVSRRATGRTPGRPLLTGLVVLFAVVGPVAVIAGLTPQVVRTGSVSHWPWEEHGVLGWWLVPLSLGLAAVCARARARPGPQDATTRVLLLVAAAATLALLYNP